MSFILAAIFSSALANTGATSGTAPAAADTPNKVPAAESAKPADCDSKDKKVDALKTDPKSAEEKTAEEKALANLGLKSDQAKKTGTVIPGATPPMETCK